MLETSAKSEDGSRIPPLKCPPLPQSMNQSSVVTILEDEPGVRDVLRRTLEQHGLTCQVFGTSAEFLSRYDPSIPGCLILDLRLPDGDGIDTLRESRRRGWRIPTLVLTAFGAISSAVTTIKLGAVDYLQKPFDPAILVAKVNEALALDLVERGQADELASVLSRFTALTPREHELLKLLVDGHPNKNVARALGVTIKTVKNHRANLMRKVQASNAADLVRLATTAGLFKD